MDKKGSDIVRYKINRLNRQEVQISPVEDLMREHGILHRILLIYKNIIRRIQVNGIHTSEEIYTYAHEATMILKQFIEEYHQVLEEEYVFPVLEQHEEYKPLIQTLKTQHESAKCTTDEILKLLEAKGRKKIYLKNSLFI